MYKKRIQLLTFLAFLLISVFATTPLHQAAAQSASAVVQRGKPSPSLTPTPMPTPPFPVTSTVYDFDSFSVQALMRSDSPDGITQATYSTIKASRGPGNLVTSSIDQTGMWLLALTDDSRRKLWITPNQAINGSQAAGPPAGYYVIQKAYSNCRDGSTVVTYPNLVNGSGNCSMAVNFFYGGVLYKLLMGPMEPNQGTTCPTGGCPATGLAKVVCSVVTSNQCVNWTITPNADAASYGVSNLYSYTGPNGGPWVFIGQYNNTFRINVSKP